MLSKTPDDRKAKSTRSATRMQNFWKRLKSLRRYTVASIVTKDSDTRPYIPLNIEGKLHFALLDSGANKSVIGGQLAEDIQTWSAFRKCHGNVKTADGQRQNISGIAEVELHFQNQESKF